MGRTDDLEDELRANWNDRTLAVYADHLQSIGDPRGELIMFDLRPDRGVERRRGELLRAWLAPLEVWWDKDRGRWLAGDRRGTFLEVVGGLVEAVLDGEDVSTLLRFFKHPACKYMCRLSISTPAVAMRAALGGFVRREHHWLAEIALRRADYLDAVLVCPDSAELVAATPALHRLEISGRRLFRALHHPTLSDLAITSHDAIDLTGAPMTSITTLDFAFEPDSEAAENGVGSVISVARFPALRSLTLWRQTGEVVFSSLARLDVLPRLRFLGLPPLMRLQDVRRTQAALDRMPLLSELMLERSYSLLGDLGADLHHEKAHVRIPDPVPWPPNPTWQMIFILAHRISIHLLVEVMEDQFDELPDDLQQIWRRLWDALLRTNHGAEQFFHAGELLRALEACAFDDAVIASLITDLRGRLQGRPFDARLSREGQ